MAYTTIDNSELYFQTKTYAGTGSEQSITLDGSEDMQPDWVWFKNRTITANHALFDSVRGATKVLNSNASTAEATEAQMLKSFGSDGFTVGTDSTVNDNDSGTINIVSWNWKAGTSFSNDASSTSIGTIDSTGSVNQDAGFSIVSFTGGGANATIKHGLTSKPSMIIVKARGQASTWSVYHTSLGATKFLRLEGTNAVGTEAGWWNNTEPTSSVFSIGTNHYADTQIAYCFHPVQGYSKFGKYRGNNSTDGTFVYTGFRPSWILIKGDASGSWVLIDTKRDSFNGAATALSPNANSVDNDMTDGSGNKVLDICATGFKLRDEYGWFNGSNVDYIYMAFAESPLVNSNKLPTNAR